jgi:hypothetical protein
MVGQVNNGLSRVTSSLELLSHTALLKCEIDAKADNQRLQDLASGRVTPSTSFTVCDSSSPATGFLRNFVSLRDTSGVGSDVGYSIEGYPSTDDMRDEEDNELSPIPSKPAENLAAYLARTRSIGNLPTSISISDTSQFLQTFTAREENVAAATDGSQHHGIFGGRGWLSRSGNLGRSVSYEQLERENAELRQRLSTKDAEIASLESTIEQLEKQVSDLRQLPTGKISQIPLEDMLQLMRDYGSELSDTAVPPRKEKVQKASVVRQFRRWNPTFFEHFYHKNGKWIPKLGKKGELERRARARASAMGPNKKIHKAGSDCDTVSSSTTVSTAAPPRRASTTTKSSPK